MYEYTHNGNNNDIMIQNEEVSEQEYSNEYQDYGQNYFHRY